MVIDLEAIDQEDSGGATTYSNFNIFFHAVDTSHSMFVTPENCLEHGSSTVISHALISISEVYTGDINYLPDSASQYAIEL